MEANEDRRIKIGRDAIDNTVITGDGNIIIITASRESAVLPKPHLPPPTGPNPYKGLAAFREEDADRFFGREEQIKLLWTTFRELHFVCPGGDPAQRLLAIHGPSGCGKSSLVRAGLIPELARRPLPGLEKARVAFLTPGSNPVEALATVLARVALTDPAPVAKTREFADELRRKNETGQYDGLRRIADALPGIDSRRLIVLVDQFEELYGLCKDKHERDVFIENILEAASDRSMHVSVILTLRSDFLYETQQNPELSTAISQHGFLVPIMTEEQLRRAICQPASNAGHPLDEPTVDLLISQTRDRVGALPLLQFALTRIWEGLSQGIPPDETLRKAGGVGGALAGAAQHIYDSLGEMDRAIVRRAFLDMVQLGEGTRDARRRVSIADIVSFGSDRDHVERVIRAFSQPGARLITLSTATDATETAEVTHESLIEHWDLLRKWLDENRDDIRFERTLGDAAHGWKAQGRPAGSLWRSPDLDRLRDFATRCDKGETPLRLTELESQFFAASKKGERIRTVLAASAVVMIALLGVVSFALFVRTRSIAAAARRCGTVHAHVPGRNLSLVPLGVARKTNERCEIRSELHGRTFPRKTDSRSAAGS